MGRSALFLFAAITWACGSSPARGFDSDDASADAAASDAEVDPDASFAGDAGDAATTRGDPRTCAEALQQRTYVGCDYWPTVVANAVWSIFDYAVVVANGQSIAATVSVTGPNGVSTTTQVAPGSLAKIYLPWVPELKGADWDNCTSAVAFAGSVLVPNGAYHLVSSVPVTVYQFNALEYKGAGGPSGKSWSACPGNTVCTYPSIDQAVGCFSYSNDATLLLPSSAMTGNYRVTGVHGWTSPIHPVMGPYFAITATANATHVRVKIASTGQVVGGNGVTATAANGVLSLTMQKGDVAEIAAPLGHDFDLSGSLVSADQPVQVIAGIPCTNVPETSAACDHLEVSVFPAETLGRDYVVARPSGPNASAVGHVVRIFGNVDATNLAYAPSRPGGCPATIDAGQVADCGVVDTDFRVTGDHEFAVGTYMLGGSLVDPQGGRGDPSSSLAVATEQFRTKYIFLAPDDYDVSFVDVVGPTSASLVLDGAPVTTPFVAVGASGLGVARIALGPGNAGAHALTSTAPVGIQVIGYGAYTSYQYPGGLDLARIAPPPPPPR